MSRVIQYVKFKVYMSGIELIPSQVHEWCFIHTGWSHCTNIMTRHGKIWLLIIN